MKNQIFQLNIKAAKDLFRAAPLFFFVNLINMLISTAAFIVQTLLFKYMIDAILYSNIPMRKVIFYMTGYYMLCILSNLFSSRINHNYIPKTKINLNYSRNIA